MEGWLGTTIKPGSATDTFIFHELNTLGGQSMCVASLPTGTRNLVTGTLVPPTGGAKFFIIQENSMRHNTDGQDMLKVWKARQSSGAKLESSISNAAAGSWAKLVMKEDFHEGSILVAGASLASKTLRFDCGPQPAVPGGLEPPVPTKIFRTMGYNLGAFLYSKVGVQLVCDSLLIQKHVKSVAALQQRNGNVAANVVETKNHHGNKFVLHFPAKDYTLYRTFDMKKVTINIRQLPIFVKGVNELSTAFTQRDRFFSTSTIVPCMGGHVGCPGGFAALTVSNAIEAKEAGKSNSQAIKGLGGGATAHRRAVIGYCADYCKRAGNRKKRNGESITRRPQQRVKHSSKGVRYVT